MDMQATLRRIEKKQKALLRKQQPSSNLEEWLRVDLTYNSNAIEGNSLTDKETAEVLEKGTNAVISGKPLRDQIEAINHANALDLVKKLAKAKRSHQEITAQDLLDIHKFILTGINDEWAGKYRQTEIFVRGSNTDFPLPDKIPFLMKEFIKWLRKVSVKHPAMIAADAHYKLVTIHPFIDGNGRLSRLLMNLVLQIYGYPLAVIKNSNRIVYMKALATAQETNDLTDYYKIVLQAVENSLDLFLNAGTEKPQKLKDNNKKLLTIGRLAKIAAETTTTIRHWTKTGLLPVREYTPSGYQLYSDETLEKIKKIRQFQQQNRLTIKEIKEKLKTVL